MKRFSICLYIILICMYIASTGASDVEDKPCLARNITGRSPVCICNATYCDTITRVQPEDGSYMAYTSSEDGLRFEKSSGLLMDQDDECEDCVLITLRPDITYQTIEGFGGAVTDAAGIHYKNMSKPLQQHFINSYFGDKGLQYNMIRVPIGGSDFSTHAYAYNELPLDDINLTNYSLSYEDYQYKLPLIKAAMRVASTPIHAVATVWSPPGWMKTSNKISGGFLKPQYYQTYADYYLKFLEHYKAEGVDVWAITTTNEPTDALLHLVPFNSLGWSAFTMGKWIVNNLGPTIRNSDHSDVKILAADDQRISIPYWFNLLVHEHPKSLKYIDGLAVHYYTDSFAPAPILDEAVKAYPDKFIIATEACEGSYPWQEKVKLGSWYRAQSYIDDIITDLVHHVVGWIDWNLCLNLKGGPNWVQNYVDASVIAIPEKGVFLKQPMFYAQGHFSKFIPRGSYRIEVNETITIHSALLSNVKHVAFLTPYNTISLILNNKGLKTKVLVKVEDKQLKIELPQRSITTIELAYGLCEDY